MVWDEGHWEPEGDARCDYQRGSLTFRLFGKKLRGAWKLIRMHGKVGDGGKNWLLMKLKDDEAADSGEPLIVDRETRSVASGRTLDEIASGSKGPRRAGNRSAARELPAQGRAQKTKMPEMNRPQLATLVREPPTGADWIFELKFDGYRLICRKEGRRVVLRTRAGHDWTGRFPTVARAAARLPVDQAMLDGEIVILAPDGTTDFQALQNVMQRSSDQDVLYYAFDLPYYHGADLTRTPILERKRILEQLISAQKEPGGVIRYSDHLDGTGTRAFRRACRSAVEGLVAKRVDSPYEQRRSGNWVKLKCSNRQEFVIGGWSDPKGSRQGLGALLLGYYRTTGKFTYCGRVGTGFTEESLADLHERLARLGTDEPPFVNPPTGHAAADAHWVKPELVAEVEYGSWTREGMLRHSVFLGLRDDKKPGAVSSEVPARTPRAERPATPRRPHSALSGKNGQHKNRRVVLTNPDRVLYPEGPITKRELAEYYEKVADWILPHLMHRPLVILRCPEGREHACFFQRHMGQGMPAAIHGIEVLEKEGTELCMTIEDRDGLVALAQLGALEIHPGGSRDDELDRPDRLIVDLDPGEGVEWSALVRAAREVRDRLNDLKLASFVRTTGGKGLHILVPLARTIDWKQLKSFAHAFARWLESDAPDRYIATMSKARRAGKIYVDYLRNERGATAIASYSTRARRGATVATPVRWDELGARLDPQAFDIHSVPVRLKRVRHDPWEGFFEVRQSLSKSALKV
jgi:bifunctional non-homologous end joining protein LigD